MKTPVIMLLALAGIAAADLPKKTSLQTYNGLWNNSPFTTKPPPVQPGETKNPLEDYALIGVSPIGGKKYRVTLINKKKPDERIMVFSDSNSSEFQILGITRKSGDPMGTVVSLKSGSVTGTVGYDEKLLTLAVPVAAAPPAPQPGQPPVPGQPQDPNQMRQPRPRVVPPPTPVPGQPQPQPQPQPQQFQQQNNQQQNTQQQNNQRPQRRRN